MSGILQFFDSIKDFLLDAFHFIGGFISDTANLIKLLGSLNTYFQSCWQFFPTSLITVLGIGVALAVLFKILGREG